MENISSKVKIPKISKFSLSVMLIGIGIAIILFLFAFINSMLFKFGNQIIVTASEIDIYATAALKSLVMSTLTALVTDILIKQQQQKQE